MASFIAICRIWKDTTWELGLFNGHWWLLSDVSPRLSSICIHSAHEIFWFIWNTPPAPTSRNVFLPPCSLFFCIKNRWIIHKIIYQEKTFYSDFFICVCNKNVKWKNCEVNKMRSSREIIDLNSLTQPSSWLFDNNLISAIQ